jgi:hypothetical protein
MDRGGEQPAPLEPVARFLRQRSGEHGVQMGQIRTVVTEPGRLVVQMLADDGDRIRVAERRSPGEKVKCRGS